MNPILLVIPILSVLMFDLGLTLRSEDFGRLLREPRAVFVGLAGQLVLLPAVAVALVGLVDMPVVFALGFVLIACCPGGSSSNVFSKLAGGDVALSVTLTALSSVITLFTIPVVMQIAVKVLGAGVAESVELPVWNLIMQNIVLMGVPIVLGFLVRSKWGGAAIRIDRVLSRCAFPALMLLAGLFFVQHRATIGENMGGLGVVATLLIILASALGLVLSLLFGLRKTQRRTIVIEVGMQNAAQAIAIATSPFVFSNEPMAIPAVIYALMMNVVLLTYVGVIRVRERRS